MGVRRTPCCLADCHETCGDQLSQHRECILCDVALTTGGKTNDDLTDAAEYISMRRKKTLNYNKHMGGVDLGGQYRKCYQARMKSRKCYKYIFWFLLGLPQRVKLLIGSYCSHKRRGRPLASSTPSAKKITQPEHPVAILLKYTQLQQSEWEGTSRGQTQQHHPY